MYAKVFDGIKELDKELYFFANKLASYNEEALQDLKKVLWKDTDHWSTLLIERAEMTGKLVLSPNTKKALDNFKK